MNHETFKTDDEIAREESPIGASSLLEELLPLIQEYFIGEISFDGNAIYYRLPNGQKFSITAQLL